jgi:nucleoside-diphosphate-sugar epimerase
MTHMVIGCGYLGKRVATRWHAQGKSVVAMTRNPARAAQFNNNGWRGVVGDVSFANPTEDFSDIETLLFAVGYDEKSGVDRTTLHPRGLEKMLAQLPNVKSVVYISTTGVYGEDSDQWVEETCRTSPDRESSAACLEAERILGEWCHVPPPNAGEVSRTVRRGTTLRLGGIYGPGRVPHLAKLRNDEPLGVLPDGFLNLIHIDDAAAITCLVAEQPSLPPVLNVTDGYPVRRGEYYTEIARQIGAAPPSYLDSLPQTPGSRRGNSNRRISNRQLLAHVDYQFLYPTYAAGLAHCLAERA